MNGPRGLDWKRVAPLLAVSLGVLYLAGRLAYAARSLTEKACSVSDPRLPGWAVVVASFFFFVAGHLVTDRRRRRRARLAPAIRRLARLESALAGHVVLALFFFGGILALAYETVGVWQSNPWHLQAITDYARCARSADPFHAMLVAVTVSFFAGHWLWPPSRRRAR